MALVGCDNPAMPSPPVPPYHELMWPALEATKALGGSATNSEMNERAIAIAGLTEEQQAVPHDPRQSEVVYRLHWARTYLKGIGALDNSARGVWSVTEHGRSVTKEVMETERKAWLASRRTSPKAPKPPNGGPPGPDGVDWKDALLARLIALPASGFERLSQRILREAGFINVNVTGRSGDGGIDGMGTYRISLVSFPVYFQCKKYAGSVSAGAVRDFRGAMAGRGEKGLLITTGTFTREATNEATRDGVVPIELIDGDRLCDLLAEYGVGVDVTQRVENVVTVKPEFFDEYDLAE